MRALPKALNDALTTGARRPAYKVYVWEISAYTAVITGTYTEAPFDLTPYVTELKWTHGAALHQFHRPRALTSTRIMALTGATWRTASLSGSKRVMPGWTRASWVWTFTGKIKGQYGYAYSRSEKAFKGQVKVYYRGAEQALKRRKITTQEYTVGTDMGITLRRHPGHVRRYRAGAPGFSGPGPQLSSQDEPDCPTFTLGEL